MDKETTETYYSITYHITPECPSCNTDFTEETTHIDMFTDLDKRTHCILECPHCETRLKQTVSHEHPAYVKIQVTPVDMEFT